MRKYRTFWEWVEDFSLYHKNGRVKRDFVTPEGHCLGHWQHYIDNIYDNLPDKKKIALHDAGYKRPKRGRPLMDFEEGFRHFLLYHVDGDLQRRFIAPDGHPTGRWVQYVRRGIVKVTPDEKKRLDEIGFKWHSKPGRPKSRK